MQARSSQGHKISITARLKRITRYAEFVAYRMSDELIGALAAMTPADRGVVLDALSRAHVRLVGNIELPPPCGDRVAWDAARIAKLKAAEAKYGTDEGIARALGISRPAAKRARWRYIGARAPRTPKSSGVAATLG